MAELPESPDECTAYAFTEMRDIEKRPYTPDEARVAKFLVELTDGAVGAGDDPIGFLMCSYAYLADARKQLLAHLEASRGGLQRGRVENETSSVIIPEATKAEGWRD